MSKLVVNENHSDNYCNMSHPNGEPNLDHRKQRNVLVLDDEGITDMGDIDSNKNINIERIINDAYKTIRFKEDVPNMNEKSNGDSESSCQKQEIPNSNLGTELNLESNRVPANFNDLTSTFFKKSSIYALNQIGNSNSTRRKVFWAFILIGGLIGCISQVCRYLKAYYEYPVVINIDSVNIYNQEFPGVTICNLNNVRKTFFPCVLHKLDIENCNELGISISPSLEAAVNWTKPYCFEKSSSNLSTEFIERMQFLSLYFSLTPTSREHYGHQGKDFIKSCAFNGEECSHTDFTFLPDNGYGNCFTFNKADSNKDPFKTAFVGPNSGLSLELDVQSEEYVWLTQSVGARVTIHDPYHEPSPQEQGINVSPGFETSLGLTKIMMTRLEYPYKDKCKEYEKKDSKRHCEYGCKHKTVSQYCGCSFGVGSLEADRHCDLTNSTEFCCVYRGQTNNDHEKSKVRCNCPLECKSSDYDMKISSGIWPAKLSNLGHEYTDVSLNDIRETKIKLKIFYDTLEQLTYEQKAMFEDSEVLSQIGGQMGLWLGLSLAAMFECVENIVLIWHYRKKIVN